MLSDKNEIDQLFSRKLEHFEKTPPSFVWEVIEARLIYRHRLMTGLKTVSIAATIVLVSLAGWWMYDPAVKSDIRVEQAAVQPEKKVIKEQISDNMPLVVNDNKNALENPQKESNIPTSKISSLPVIPSNTNVIAGNGQIANPKSGDQVVTVPDIEKPGNSEPDHTGTGKPIVQFVFPGNTDHGTSSVTDIKAGVSCPFKTISPDVAAGVTVFHRNQKKNKTWSLKAEFAPVLSNRPQNNVQISELNSPDSQNSNVKINSETSITAGILAGYKVSKRITVRSGVAYRNIRQTGQNNDDNYLNRRFEYVEVPVQASFKLAESRLWVSIAGGFSAACLIGNHEVLSVNNEQTSIGKTAGMQSLTYSGLLGLEIGYDITKHLTITVEPRLRHDLNSLSAFNSVNYKADHLEIATGLTYCFD